MLENLLHLQTFIDARSMAPCEYRDESDTNPVLEELTVQTGESGANLVKVPGLQIRERVFLNKNLKEGSEEEVSDDS